MGTILLKLSDNKDISMLTEHVKVLHDTHQKLVRDMQQQLKIAEETYLSTFKNYWEKIADELIKLNLVSTEELETKSLYFDHKTDELGFEDIPENPLPAKATIAPDKKKVSIDFQFDKSLDAEAAKAFADSVKKSVMENLKALDIKLVGPVKP